MFAAKVARPLTVVSEDSALRVGRRPWQSSDTERTRALPHSPAAFHHDFSSVGMRGGAEHAITIPFRAVIRAATDAAEEPRKAQVAAEPSETEESVAPEERDEDEEMPGAAITKGSVADSVSATFAYSPTIEQTSEVLEGGGHFGRTTGSLEHFRKRRIARGTGTFTATADLRQTVKWDVAATGPNGEIDIASENDPDLTSANYTDASIDLAPDMSDLKGRSPRHKFWCKDLSEVHERYHIKDFVDKAREGAKNAETWLAGQTAASKREVRALLDTAWNDKIFTPWDTFTNPPGVEERAYADGADAYRTRADRILVKGIAGEYPDPP
jgi:hypothetical protein